MYRAIIHVWCSKLTAISNGIKGTEMIEFTKTIIVHADMEYDYVVTDSDNCKSVDYRERDEIRTTISFGSREEMRAVAKAMLDLTGE